MPFPNWIGRKRLWTRERVVAALAAAATEIKGPLPCRDALYSKVKKGRLDWPTASRVLFYFHSMARGWLVAGASRHRISLKNIDWTPEEDGYLLDEAGILTLEYIAAKLRRSYPAVRDRLNKKYGIESRHNQGYLSAAELSKEYGCPYHRVRTALVEGRIPGRYDEVRNRWQVDPGNLTPAAEAILKAPKLHSYKNSQTDLGDYYQRYGLRRTMVDGRVMVVET